MNQPTKSESKRRLPLVETGEPTTPTTTPTTVDEVFSGSPYVSYLYSYPHKMAYRRLETPQDLGALWAAEDRSALFLYMHIPFCEMRCGFCNLFTTPRPKADPVAEYVAALERQARVVSDQIGNDPIGNASFARIAIGGGTPTYLGPSQLERVFAIASETLGIDLANTPISVETSPETGTSDRLAVLASAGVDRVSMGVQSFIDSEVAGVGRAQKREQVEETIRAIREHKFATLNLDLMYGLEGQTPESWAHSLDVAMAHGAEEIFIYPLYVRPLTGLGRRQAPSGASWDDERLAYYRQARDLLRNSGYQQISMRMFRRTDAIGGGDGPIYKCQSDGMLGLGVGSRSYTEHVHYSSEYAVGNKGVKGIIADFVEASDEEHRFANYGVTLTDEDRRRRFVILSLLSAEGLNLTTYNTMFGTVADSDFTELGAMATAGATERLGDVVRLTDRGMERSDAIGPWLRSRRVNQLIDSYDLT